MAHIFPVYSIAKPFLAQAVIELSPELESPIGDLVPILSPVYASRTIGTLLNHTSGLADYGSIASYHQAVANHEPAWPRQTLLEICSELKNDHSGFQYSNVGYLLLRMFVEQQTGGTMFEAIDTLVLKPLEISGFSEWESTSSLVPDYDPRWVYSGTFTATSEALQSGFLKLMKHRAATTGLSQLATQVSYENTGFDNPHYGAGLMMDLKPCDQMPAFVGHGGGGPGFAHMILVQTKEWRVGLESSQTDFNQTEAILRLRDETSLIR